MRGGPTVAASSMLQTVSGRLLRRAGWHHARGVARCLASAVNGATTSTSSSLWLPPGSEGLVLGIESSCDDTGVAVVSSSGRVLGEALATQAEIHAAWGGVVPKLAQEAHEAAIDGCVDAALAAAGVEAGELAGVAVTVGPGLSLCLRVGVRKAHALAARHALPLVPVHHMEAHALVARLGRQAEVAFPFLCLLVSGGHNLLLLVEGVGQYIQLGTTLDDALGEAYDKVARLLGLDLRPSGGAALEAIALRGDPHALPLSVPMQRQPNCDFSYAGLKTAVRLAVEARGGAEADLQTRADIAASFQRVAVQHLEDRVRRAASWAAESHPAARQLVVAGGVASNAYVRARLGAVAEAAGLGLVVPPPRLCTDNGVMVAWAGVERMQLGLVEDLPVHPLTSIPRAAAAAATPATPAAAAAAAAAPPPAAGRSAAGASGDSTTNTAARDRDWVELRPRWPLTDRKDPRAYVATRSAKKKRVFPSLEQVMAAQQRAQGQQRQEQEPGQKPQLQLQQQEQLQKLIRQQQHQQQVQAGGQGDRSPAPPALAGGP